MTRTDRDRANHDRHRGLAPAGAAPCCGSSCARRSCAGGRCRWWRSPSCRRCSCFMRVARGADLGDGRCRPRRWRPSLGAIFQLFFLRLVVFFVCFTIFTYLVRGEIAERSLHFYLMAPLRRDVFLIGKFIAGLIAAAIIVLVEPRPSSSRSRSPPASPKAASPTCFEGPGAGHAADLLRW